MERVSFLLEATNEQISCLLNPEKLTIRRYAGVRMRHSLSGTLSSAALREYPILYTGGGHTEIEMQLLFDTTLDISGSAATVPRIEDVRNWTNRLHLLTEAQQRSGEQALIPIIRMIWGRDWNIPGVISHLAERLEYFTLEGVPRRSWLTVRMLRVDVAPRLDDERRLREWQNIASQVDGLDSLIDQEGQDPTDILALHDFREGDRLDTLAEQYYGNVHFWRLIARYNQITDPFDIPIGRRLLIPSADVLERTSIEAEGEIL